MDTVKRLHLHLILSPFFLYPDESLPSGVEDGSYSCLRFLGALVEIHTHHRYILGLSDSRNSIHYRDSTAYYSNTIITFPVFVQRVGTSKSLGTSHRVFTAHAY